MSKCDLYLDNYVNGYQPGQNILGHVKCTFTSEKSVKGIAVQIKGVAKTRWSETEQHYNHTTKKHDSVTVWYHGEQTLVHHEIDALPHVDDQVIAQGVYNYPFSYLLPSHLPSSFSGNHGDITYSVKAIVRRPLLKINYEAESPIQIIGIINLNDNPALKNPITQTKTKNVGCCWWKSGPITFEWNIPYTGFIPGQNIPININIENLSNSSIEKVKCKITQTVRFKSHHPSHKTKANTARIADVELGGVGAHGERTYHDIFPVPGSIKPPNFQGCSIIAVEQRLEVEAYMPCFVSNISKSVPIVLGHIPLREANLDSQNVLPLPSYDTLQFPSAPVVPGMVAAPNVPNTRNVPSAPNAPNAPAMASAPFYDGQHPPQAPIGWQMPTPSAEKFETPPPDYEDAVLLENPYRKKT